MSEDIETNRPSAGSSLFAGPGEMAGRVRELDWSATAVGPVAAWPASLVTAVEIMLRSEFPMFLAWGRGLTMLYNDAYIPVLGGKHPAALGSPTEEVWREIWDVLGPLAGDVLDGRASYAEDLLLVMVRAGYEEETYFTFSYSPIPDGATSDNDSDNTAAAGLFCACTETTRRVVGERRLTLLSALGELPTTATNIGVAPVVGACVAAARVLESNRADVPYAMVYLCEPDGASARLVASYGVRIGRGVAPQTVPDPDSGTSIWRAATTGNTQVSTGLATRYPDLILPVPDAIGDAMHDTAVVVPLRVGPVEAPAGVLVVGVSPYRPLDGDYRAFIDLVAGHVASAIDDARAHEAEHRRTTALTELDRAKTEFFANISHEFRTPLTLMMGPVEELLAGPIEGQDRARLDMVARNGLRLGRLVNNLLEFSRIQAGHHQLTYKPVELAAYTADLASVFRSATDQAGLELVVDCPPLAGPVWVDRDMWEKVVLNLVSNAVKYTISGSITVALRPDEVSAARDGDGAEHGPGVVLTVTDTGIGVSAHELPKLFDRFHRIPDARGRSIEGSGIGLALTRQLVEAHRGTITATSVLDVGTTLTVTIPTGPIIDPIPLVVEAPGETAPAAVTAAVSAVAGSFVAEARGWFEGTSAADGRGTDFAAATTASEAGPTSEAALIIGGSSRVLVIDDNADMRAYLTRLLTGDYRVDTAGDGAAGLAAARADPPDLVITDVMMPGLDGFELLAALRADPATAHIPIIVVSARAGEETATHGLAAGADDYVVKPFSAHDLRARVASNLALARLRHQDGAWRSAMINALQDGFSIMDPTGEVVEINDAFTAMLGFGRDGLPYVSPHPWWPEPAEDPDGFAQTADTLTEVQRVGRGRFLLPLRHRDGHRVWADCSVDSVPGRDGNGRVIVTTIRDVTATRRAEQRDRLLAETGRLLTVPAGLIERLTALADAAVGVLAELAVVSLAGPDGRFTPVAAAHRSDPDTAKAVLGFAPHTIPATLRDAYQAGRAFVLPAVDDRVLAEAAAGAEDLAARQAITVRSSLVTPLVVAGRLLGSLTFVSLTGVPAHDDADLGLAEELGRRVTGIVEADRVATREHQLQAATAALAAAGTLDEAAAALGAAVTTALGAAGTAVFVRGPDDTHLHLIHTTGYPAEVAASFARIRADADLPAADAARTRTGVWLGDQQAWLQRYPHMAVPGAAETAHAVTALPLTIGNQVLGVLTASFPTARTFPGDERGFALTLVGQAAQAFERAATSDAHFRIAQTLQRSLLPARLPTHPRLAVAARYLPAGRYSQAGGDWYDVIALDADRVAITVGDVVGNGAAAAAIMGQLRSALIGFLLESHAPAHAIGWLSRLAARIDGARGSTAICLVLHTGTGELRWARAGHPPPLLLQPAVPTGSVNAPGGVRYLDDGHGIVLGFSDTMAATVPYTEGHTVLAPGASVVVYTDGLVERRGEIIDDGLDRLAAAAAHHPRAAPHALVAAMLHAGLDGAGPSDDVAVIVARLLPGPLDRRVPATPAQLGVLRRDVANWAAAAALPDILVEDLQLALGEAAANAVEHAYRSRRPGELRYHLVRAPDGGVQVEVGDEGTWRPPPPHPGYRGRGLAMIKALGKDVTVDTTGPETCVRFTLPAPPEELLPGGPPPIDPTRPQRPPATATRARLVAERDGAALVLRLSGDIDLATIDAVRDALRDQVRATPTEIILDTCEVTYLASAGVGLLLEAITLAPERVRIHLQPGSPAARILALTGLDATLTPSTPTT